MTSAGGVPALEATHVSKRFGSVTALSDVTVTIDAPATGLLGANGAGKSTLMRLALGLLSPDSGDVRLLGLGADASRAAVRSRVGYMPEHACLPRTMTAVDLVVHLAQMRGLPRRDAVRRTSEVLFAVGLEEERRRLIGTFSLGMAQRTKLAQALVHGPELVVLDEPTNGLDPAGRAEMLAIVRRLSADLGIRVLLSSHVLSDVEQTCDQVVVLREGRVAAVQPVRSDATGPRDVTVRVTSDPHALVARLTAASLGATLAPDGGVHVDAADDAALDTVRDAAEAVGAGILSLTDRRADLEDAVIGAMT
ncbi:MAG: ABC transporter ATP-binding protein [Actinomycetes bacterium]